MLERLHERIAEGVVGDGGESASKSRQKAGARLDDEVAKATVLDPGRLCHDDTVFVVGKLRREIETRADDACAQGERSPGAPR